MIEILETRIAPALVLAVDTSNNLLKFDSATPGTVTALVPITGLAATESIEAIDVRPATGELYALGIVEGTGSNPDTGRLYKIDSITGVATLVGAGPFSTTLSDANRYGLDFNPVVDRIRLVSDADTNMRLNPNTGAIAGNDTNLSPSGTAVGVAYDRNFASTTTTTLFAIDAASDNLVRIGGVNGSPSPNGGAVTVIGPLGVNTTGIVGFDILDVDKAAAALTVGGVTQLYTINLVSGAATLVGDIASANPVLGFTFAPPSVKIVNATTATYTEPDGDHVTIKTSRGTLNPDLFRLSVGGPAERGQLQTVDLTDVAFKGSSFTLSVVRAADGDGLAAVGIIDATGNDLGAVKIKGDLGRIDAGDVAALPPGLASLSVNSLGRYATATGAPDLHSHIQGKLGRLTVTHDVKDGFIETAGLDGSIGPITIGGSLIGGAVPNSGRISAAADMGATIIKGDIVGGPGSGSGQLVVNGHLTSLTLTGSLLGSSSDGGRISVSGAIDHLTIGGDVIGSTGTNGARVQGGAPSGVILIKGDVRGGDGSFSGALSFTDTVRSLTIRGSLIGADGSSSADVQLGNSSVSSGSISIGGDVLGGSGAGSGAISLFGGLKNLTVRGSLVGGDANSTGFISSASEIRALTIGRDLLGGNLAPGNPDLVTSGAIQAPRIGSVLVGGNVATGLDNSAVGALLNNASIRVFDDLGSVIIKGSLLGSTGAGGDTTRAIISARGQANLPATATTDVAIKGLAIGHRVEFANILAGYNSNLVARNADAQIGKVTVGGSWTASNLIAGISSTNGNFGDADDAKIDELTATGSPESATIVSKIGPILIKGEVLGTPASVTAGDHFGFVAQQIASLTVGARHFPLAAGPASPTDLPGILVGNTNDIRVREVGL